jgi:hypothetical protein
VTRSPWRRTARRAVGCVVVVVAGGGVAARAAAQPANRVEAGGRNSRSPRQVHICAGGDVTLGTNLDTAWALRVTDSAVDPFAALRAPDSLVTPLRAMMRGADVALVNAEGAIGDGPVTAPKCAPGQLFCFSLRQPRAAAHALRTLVDSPAVVVVNLANNHAHDAGADGFLVTLALLDSAGVLVTGQDSMPTLVGVSGRDTLAILGFSSWSDPGVRQPDAVRRLVARAAARYRWVVVTAHMGAEGANAQHTADSVERYAGEVRGNPVAFAHSAVDAGALLVIAHGPHVLRAIEWWGRGLIAYSLGNLINYGPFALGAPRDRAAVLCATLDRAGRIRASQLRPTNQTAPGEIAPDSARVALRLVAELSRADFPETGALVDQVSGAIRHRRRRLRATGTPRSPDAVRYDE